MCFIWHPFDLAVVTPPRHMCIARENPKKRKKCGKACRLPLLKPESKIMAGWRWWFTAQAPKPLQSQAVECSKEQRNGAAPPSFTQSTHLNPVTADCFEDNILAILLLKPDPLHACELMTTGSQGLSAQPGWVAQHHADGPTSAVRGYRHPKLSHIQPESGGVCWVASIWHKHQLAQAIIKPLNGDRGDCRRVP